MRSMLLVSIVIAALAIPALAARDPSPRRGLWRTIVGIFVFDALYLAYLVLVHPHLFVPGS